MTFTINNYDNMQRQYIFQDDGKVIVKKTQDVEKLLNYCENKRNNESQNSKVEEFKHYASIPMIIAEKLITKGINIFDKNCAEDFQKEIEINYPYLKVTNLKGW